MKKPLIVLVGNKVDETSRRQVSDPARRGRGVLPKLLNRCASHILDP